MRNGLDDLDESWNLVLSKTSPCHPVYLCSHVVFVAALGEHDIRNDQLPDQRTPFSIHTHVPHPRGLAQHRFNGHRKDLPASDVDEIALAPTEHNTVSEAFDEVSGCHPFASCSLYVPCAQAIVLEHPVARTRHQFAVDDFQFYPLLLRIFEECCGKAFALVGNGKQPAELG